jgi:hypothetical protein
VLHDGHDTTGCMNQFRVWGLGFGGDKSVLHDGHDSTGCMNQFRVWGSLL